MSLEKEFVPYELAVKLRELGFNEECLARFDYNDKLVIVESNEVGRYRFDQAPLWQQAFGFLLKKLDKGIRIWYDGSGAICSWKDDSIDVCFNTKEEALYLLIEDYEKTCKSEN